MIKYSIFTLFLFLFSCQNQPRVKPEPVVKEPEQKEEFKYKTYKRITGISNIESNLLKKHNDVDGVTREILNIYDKTKGAPPVSNSEE